MKNSGGWFKKKTKIRKCRTNEEWSARSDSVANHNISRDKSKLDTLSNYDVPNEQVIQVR